MASPAVAPHSSRQQVQRYGYKGGAKIVEMRTQPRAPLHINCARYGTTPNLGKRPCSRKQRRCSLRPKVRPDERPCDNLCASQRQMAVPTDEEDRRREPMTGANAKSRVGYGGENHCASPTTAERSPSRNNVFDHR